MKKILAAAMTCAALISGLTAAGAQSLDIMSQIGEIVEKSSNELAVQINLSGKQRMLTQKMSKESFLVALGIDPDANRANLKKTMALFDRTLKGLKNGDEGLKLAKAPNAKIAAQLDVVMKLWKTFQPLVAKVAAGSADAATLTAIAKNNLPLLREMNKAVKMFEKAAGADTGELAVVINLSGRQRMLTQKMTKEYLLIALGIDPDANRANLKKTMALFDRTLKGLLDGDPEQGLPGTKDEKIRAQLKKVMALWANFAPLLKKPATPETLRAIAQDNLPLLAEMNRAVKMYEQSW